VSSDSAITVRPGAGIPRRVFASIRHALPRGRTLPDSAWKPRHHALLAFLWVNALGLLIFGMARGYDFGHGALHAGAPIAFAVLAMAAGNNRRLASAMVSMGLITCSALLVHIWDGVIEAHFHFFVVIVMLTLYEDWLPFLLAFGYVVLHHGMTGTLDSGAVYNHPDAVAHPWKWAAIHGMFVAGAAIAGIAAWRLNEDVRAETRRAYDMARRNEELFMGAFDKAPIGMALASVDPERAGRFLQVNDALCEFTGYDDAHLLENGFASVTHPEDVKRTLDHFHGLLARDVTTVQDEVRYVHAEGHALWAMVSMSLVCDEADRPVYVIGQIEDIGDRKRAEEKLEYDALHDSLTGLGNRRAFFAGLEEQLSRASREQPLVLLLLDLDGFKGYNDTFGHPAGDALLRRLGKNLAAAVDGTGVAYRFGGDEFCVVATCTPGGHDSVAAIASEALSERGEGFSITATYGSALLPMEASTAEDAVRIADQRMYGRKGLGRASAGRQSSDVLVRMLAERSPVIEAHLSDVTQLCEAVARRLGLGEEETGPLLLAAALHDVGKAAIPDAILGKASPLDTAEWKFIRRHPVIGERIMSAAPALAHAARLVRWSHERWDGRGYPDGLKGEEIPVGSRVISVCDAFDAMTSGRPYRQPISADAAVAELQACAGTQFDPAVVDAFVAAMAAGEIDSATQVAAPAVAS
jgi:diguanylate cyclase (GGDEF)-like protein/PAS domain S-box-containing protein